MPPPPSVDGGDQRTVAWASPALAVTDLGADGRCTETVNHELINPRSNLNVSPVTVTDAFDPKTVSEVMRPPHSSLIVRPDWSVPERFSRLLTRRLVNEPIDGYVDCSCDAVTVSVQLWLFHESLGTPSQASGRLGR